MVIKINGGLFSSGNLNISLLVHSKQVEIKLLSYTLLVHDID